MRREERGAGTVLVVTCAALLLWLGLALAVVAAVVLDHRRAQAAADLAALAGAEAVATGTACATADRAATANGADLRECHVLGSDVVVDVGVTGPTVWGWTFRLSAQARAGPGPLP